MSHQSHNIHASTQAVTKVGVHGSNNALAHLGGAPRIITRTRRELPGDITCGALNDLLMRVRMETTLL